MKKILVVVILFTACKHSNKESLVSDKIPIKINLVKSSKKENLIDYIKNVSVLKLQTGIKLVNIDKVVYYNNNYYTLDKKTSNLLVFNDNGNFLKKIGDRGNGPGEYKKITDFEIDKKNKLILILSQPNNSIFKFTLEGHFFEKVQLDFPTHGFTLLNNGTYVFMSGRFSRTYHTLTRTDIKGNVLNIEFPFPKDIAVRNYAYTGGIHKQGRSNYFTEATSSIIYEIQDSIKPLYQFSFGNDTWKEENRFDLEKFSKDNRASKASYLLNFYCDTEKVLAFRYRKDKYYRRGFYFKKSGKTLAVPFNLKESLLYLFLSKQIGIKKNHFISSLDYSLFEAIMNSEEAKEFRQSYPEFYNTLKNELKDFTEHENPYLLIYEIKDNT